MSYGFKVANEKKERAEALERALFFACAEIAMERYRKGNKLVTAADVVKEMKVKGGCNE